MAQLAYKESQTDGWFLVYRLEEQWVSLSLSVPLCLALLCVRQEIHGARPLSVDSGAARLDISYDSLEMKKSKR
jgi:hypothetical protein